MKFSARFLLLASCLLQISCNSKQTEKSTVANSVPDNAVQKVSAINHQKAPEAVPDTTVINPAPDLNVLSGKWRRMDGGYELHISNIKSEGTFQAGYFNPNPIHVESTKWEFTNNYLYVMVKLQDVNYPGSTYTLQYFPEVDKLAGVYYQAVEGTNYDVVFDRVR